MAITPVNARYEGFIFDGENSRTYGVYITDVEVFGAPVRNVEMVTIPGRNGAFALDKGSYENIEVTYHCAMGCDSQADFNAGISAFRNMLASRTGYKRLEDEINTSEYRMACFRGGISVPTLNKETATFDVVFDCQPQRFLKSGESEISVTSGQTVTNPTLFEASPLLQAWGYGDININDETVTINDVIIGNILLSPAVHSMPYANYSQSMLRANDIITVNSGTEVLTVIQMDGGSVFHAYRSEIYSDVDHIISRLSTHISSYGNVNVIAEYKPVNFYAGDVPRQYSATVHTYIEYTPAGGTRTSITYEIHYSIQDLSANSQRRIQVASAVITSDPTLVWYFTPHEIGEITAYSTKSALGEPLYFDLDIGEAYKIENDDVISINNAVTIPAKLPVLVPGTNTITYENNTIDQLKIVPRWWQL